MVSLMSYNFRSLDTVLAITLVDPDRKLTSSSGEGGDDAAAARAALIAAEKAAESVSKDDRSPMLPLNAKELLSTHLSHHDMKRLELYSRNMVDHHMIIDTLPTLSKLLFTGRMPGLRLSYLQVAILLGTGLQHRDVDSLASELEIPVSQVLAFFNKTVRKIVSYLRSMVEADVSKSLPSKGSIHAVRAKAGEMETLTTSLADEQTTNAADFSKQQKEKDDARSALLKKGKGASKHSLGGVRDEDLEAAAQLSAKKSKAPLTSISVAVPTPDKSNESGASTGKKAKKDKKRKQSEVGTDDSGDGNMIAEVSDVDGDDAVKASGKKDKSKKKKKLSIA
jgi:N-acetyltransferase 10